MNVLYGKKVFVTGGAGFIGSNITARLLFNGAKVTCYDNLSLGKLEFLKPYMACRNFKFVKADLLDAETLSKNIRGHELILHLAANSDIREGTAHTDIDLKCGTLATYNVLEAMRISGIKKIIFASTSAVYGEAAAKTPTSENYGPLLPISFYGASKLACEGLISAFAHNFNYQAWIFRFANIVGPNMTHGAIFDFINKLKVDPKKLEVLGDGKQSKPYLHVDECVDGMLFGYGNSHQSLNIFNLACEGATSVKMIAKTVVSEINSAALISYTGEKRGWTGDVPYVRLDPSKLKKLGWKAKLSSDEAVKLAIKQVINN
jgi:UDP-glucose 4-epimerase